MDNQIPKGQYCELNIAEINLPENSNPREPEPQGHLFGLKDSFETIGQLEAVIVSKADDKYYAVAGRRRIEAAKQAGLTTIEAKVYENVDRRMLLLMLAAENIHRRAFTVIEEARLIQMLEEEKFHIKAIASMFNMNIDTIRRKRNLLELPDDIQKMTIREHFPLPAHQAGRLLGLSKSQQLQAARQIAPITGPVANEEQAKQIIDELKGEKLDIDTRDLDKRPGLPIPRGAKPPKLKTGKRPEKKEKATQQQKKAVPKVPKLKSKKTIGPDIEITICGKIGMEFISTGVLDFDDAEIFLRIASGPEKVFKEANIAVDIAHAEKSGIVTAIAEYFKKALPTKDKKRNADVSGCMECPKCKSTGGFSCEDSSSKDRDKAKWKCLKCGKIFLR